MPTHRETVTTQSAMVTNAILSAIPGSVQDGDTLFAFVVVDEGSAGTVQETFSDWFDFNVTDSTVMSVAQTHAFWRHWHTGDDMTIRTQLSGGNTTRWTVMVSAFSGADEIDPVPQGSGVGAGSSASGNWIVPGAAQFGDPSLGDRLRLGILFSASSGLVTAPADWEIVGIAFGGHINVYAYIQNYTYPNDESPQDALFAAPNAPWGGSSFMIQAPPIPVLPVIGYFGLGGLDPLFTCVEHLTVQQRTAEDAGLASGWNTGAASTTIAPSTIRFHGGTASHKLTRTSQTSAFMGIGLPWLERPFVTPGQTVEWNGWVYLDTATVSIPDFQIRLLIDFYDEAGSPVGANDQVVLTPSGGAWFNFSHTETAPVGADSCYVYTDFYNPHQLPSGGGTSNAWPAGTSFYLDDLSIQLCTS